MNHRSQMAAVFASGPSVLRQAGESCFGIASDLIYDHGRRVKAAPEFVESLQNELRALATKICGTWPVELLDVVRPADTIPNVEAPAPENILPIGDSSLADAGSTGQ